MRIITYIILLLIVLLGLTFAGLNADPVTLNYYIGSSNISLSLLLVCTLGFGALVGILVALVPLIRARQKNSKLKQKVQSIEQEVANLRSIPIKDSH